LYNVLLAKVYGESQIALVVVSSGIVTLLLTDSRTVYSWFKIPINLNENSTCLISYQMNIAVLLKKAMTYYLG